MGNREAAEQEIVFGSAHQARTAAGDCSRTARTLACQLAGRRDKETASDERLRTAHGHDERWVPGAPFRERQADGPVVPAASNAPLHGGAAPREGATRQGPPRVR